MIKPLKNRVVTKPIVHEDKVIGGIIIPKSEDPKQQPNESIVVEVGPDCQWIKKGDLVMASRYGGTDVKVEGVEYKIFNEWDIIAILSRGE